MLLQSLGYEPYVLHMVTGFRQCNAIQYHCFQENAIFVVLLLSNFYEDGPRKGTDSSLAHFEAIFCGAEWH